MAKQSMMILITMVVVSGVGLRASASLRSLGRSSQRETWWATLTSRGHHTKPHLPPLLKAETRLARPLAVSGTSSAEWKQRNSELVQIAEEPKRAK